MGKLRENMEKLVNEVRSCASARHRGVVGVRFAARDLLAQDRREGGERRQTLGLKARALSTRLAEGRKVRLRTARELKSGRRGEVAEIRAAVGELRGRVQAVMGGIAQDVAQAGRLWRTTGPARLK